MREVVITRAGRDPVVIVALDDYQSLKEAAYLLRSPENARRLLAAIDRLEHGGGATRELLIPQTDEVRLGRAPGPITWWQAQDRKVSSGSTRCCRRSYAATRASASRNP